MLTQTDYLNLHTYDAVDVALLCCVIVLFAALWMVLGCMVTRFVIKQKSKDNESPSATTDPENMEPVGRDRGMSESSSATPQSTHSATSSTSVSSSNSEKIEVNMTVNMDVFEQ